MSAQIRDRLKEQAIWKNAGSVLFFAPLPDELDVWPLLEDALAGGKIAALPRFDSGRQQLRRVPGAKSAERHCDRPLWHPSNRRPRVLGNSHEPLRFDFCAGRRVRRQGNRLGRGKGFYDRLLAGVRGVKCGIALDEQLVSDVPAGPADVRMNLILTPTRSAEIAG